MTYRPLTGQQSNNFASIGSGITLGSKVKVTATGYRAGQSDIVFNSDPITITGEQEVIDGAYPKNYPLRRLYDLINAASSGDVIDLQGNVYWLNLSVATGDDGLTYGSVGDIASGPQLDQFYLNKGIEIKNGTIILYEESQLTNEGSGVYSTPYDSSARTRVMVFDPAEISYTGTIRLAKYPPQPTGKFTNFTVDGNSFKFDKNILVSGSTNEAYTGSLVTSANGAATNGSLDGIFIDAGTTAGFTLSNDIKTMLDSVVSSESFSGRTAAAEGCGILTRVVPNIIKITTIKSYEESAAGITLTFNDSYKRNDNDHYLNAFNFFGRKSFGNTGDGVTQGVATFAPSISENKIFYTPSSGVCNQLWQTVNSFRQVSSSGVTMGAGFGNGFLVINGSSYDPTTNTVPESVTLDNITFVGGLGRENTSRGAIFSAVNQTGCMNISVTNCKFYNGDSTGSFIGGSVNFQNNFISYPQRSGLGVIPHKEVLIKNNRILGLQNKSAISTSNLDKKTNLTGSITVTGNYFNLSDTNHGQAISSYGTSWPRYKIYGNIFHNCQRSISLQAGGWAEYDYDLYYNDVLQGPGYVYANNLIYHDDNPVYPLGGQMGWSYNGTHPQTQLLITVEDPDASMTFNSDQVPSFTVQKETSPGVYEDYNMFFEPILAGPTTDYPSGEIFMKLSIKNESIPSWESNFDSENLIDGELQYSADYEYPDPFPPDDAEVDSTYEGEHNSFSGSRAYEVAMPYRSNIFKKLLWENEDQLYLKTNPDPNVPGSDVFAKSGIKILNIFYSKPSSSIEVFRNTSIMGYDKALEIFQSSSDPLDDLSNDPYRITRALTYSPAGSQDAFDVNGDGDDDYYAKLPGSNGPMTFVDNISYNFPTMGYSGGTESSPNYAAEARRLYGAVTASNNIIMSSKRISSGGSAGLLEYSGEEVYRNQNNWLGVSLETNLGITYSYVAGLTHVFNNIESGDLTPTAAYNDKGILFTDNGLPTGNRIFPDLRTLRNLDVNWADAYIPVDPDLLVDSEEVELVNVDFVHIAEVQDQVTAGTTFELEIVADTWDPSKSAIPPVFGVSDSESTQPTSWSSCGTKTINSVGRDAFSSFLIGMTFEDGKPEEGDKVYTIYNAIADLGGVSGEKWIWVKSKEDQEPRANPYDTKVRKLRVFKKDSIVTETAGSTAELKDLLEGPSADIVDTIICDFVSSNTDSTGNNLKNTLRNADFARTSERMLTIKPSDGHSADCVFSLERWEGSIRSDTICKNLCLDGFVFGSLTEAQYTGIFGGGTASNLWLNNAKILNKYVKGATGQVFGKTMPGDTGDWALPLGISNNDSQGYTKNGARAIGTEDSWGHRVGEDRTKTGRTTADGGITNGDYVVSLLYDKSSWISAGNAAGNVNDGEYVLKIDQTKSNLYYSSPGASAEIPSEYRDVSSYNSTVKAMLAPTEEFGFRDPLYMNVERTFNDGSDHPDVVVVSGSIDKSFSTSKYHPSATPGFVGETFNYTADGTQEYFVRIGISPVFIGPQVNYIFRRVCDNDGGNLARKILEKNPQRWGSWGALEGSIPTDGGSTCEFINPVWEGVKTGFSITNSCFCGNSAKAFARGSLFKHNYAEDIGADYTFGQDCVILNNTAFRPRSSTSYTREDTRHLDFFQFLGNGPDSANMVFKGFYVYSESDATYQFGIGEYTSYGSFFNNYFDNIYAVKSQAEFHNLYFHGRYHNYRFSNSDLGKNGQFLINNSGNLTSQEGVYSSDGSFNSSYSNCYIDNLAVYKIAVSAGYYDPTGLLPLNTAGFPKGKQNALWVSHNSTEGADPGDPVPQERINELNNTLRGMRVAIGPPDGVSLGWPKHYEGVYWAGGETLPELTNHGITFSNLKFSNS